MTLYLSMADKWEYALVVVEQDTVVQLVLLVGHAPLVLPPAGCCQNVASGSHLSPDVPDQSELGLARSFARACNRLNPVCDI
jgi:hypothetical protein